MSAVLTGCSATIGPYVADIQEMPDGRLLVIRCTTEVSQTGQMTTYENGDSWRHFAIGNAGEMPRR
jgi:hypothetical protein